MCAQSTSLPTVCRTFAPPHRKLLRVTVINSPFPPFARRFALHRSFPDPVIHAFQSEICGTLPLILILWAFDRTSTND